MNKIQKIIKSTLLEYLNEGFSDEVQYKTETHEDGINIFAYYNNKKIGSITSKILIEPYEYEFSEDMSEDEFYDIYSDGEIVKIEYLTVDDYYQGKGLATKLMNKLLDTMHQKGYKQYYLNASPMGFKGLPLEKLVKFYKKFGFRKFLNQGNNILMYKILN